MEKKKLPTLAELHHAPELAFKNDQLKTLLNQQPPSNWTKDHPMARGVKYLPIGRVEFMLDKIFQEWRVEVLSYSALFNSVSCHVRIHFRNPVTGEMTSHDGVGAMAVQTDKGESAANLAAIKSDAVMKALPAAKSYAIKNACAHIGVLFGRDLNRDDLGEFKGAYSTNENDKTKERARLIEWLKSDKITIADLTDFSESEVFARYESDQEIMNIYNLKFAEL